MWRVLLQSLLFVILMNSAIARGSREGWRHSNEHKMESDEDKLNLRQPLYLNDCPKVNHHLPIIIGSVLGAVIVALLVVIVILIVLLRRRSSVQVQVPPMATKSMFSEQEKKPIMTMDYPPMYADVMKTAPELPHKQDLSV